jgi:SAM-dependent methyltransferase
MVKGDLNASAAKAQQMFYRGERREALESIVSLQKRYPEVDLLKKMLAFFAGEAGDDVPLSKDFADVLVMCLDEGHGDVRKLLLVAAPVLGANGAFIGALAMVSTGNFDANRNALLRGWLDPVLTNSLFLSLMRNVILTNREYELALTKLRKQALLSNTEGSEPNILMGVEFLSSLAMQSRLNEYVYYVDEEEVERLEGLRGAVEKEMTETSEVSDRLAVQLLLLAMYQPLQELNIEEGRWDQHGYVWPLSMAPLVKGVSEYYREKGIKKQIQEIGIVKDRVSMVVKEQYEENPYPRWTSLPDSQKITFGHWISAINNNFESPQFLSGPVRLLVAGCGTGRELLWLNSLWETSQVLAVDLSRSSLAYAIRKAQEMGVSGAIKFRQADILELKGLPEEYKDFDVIVCSGVLHHMNEPFLGWRVLVGLLRPGGVMKIGLYSELARALVVKAREVIYNHNIPPTMEGIREFRKDMFSGKYPELLGLKTNTDMFSTSMCRDLLFHVQEWRFTIKEIQGYLEKLGLEFIGFEGVEKSKQVYRRMFPDDHRMGNLVNWASFEQQYPDTFESMYNILAQKK